MSMFEYDQWILDELTHLNIKYPELMKEYVFDRVLYWKITVCHNVKIKRDKEWFNSVYPKFKELWDRIVLYRSNTKELNKFLRSKKVEINKENENLFVDTESEES